MAEHVLEGTVYVRPVGRGVVMIDPDVYVDEWIEKALGGCHRFAKVRLTLTVEDSWDQEDESRPDPYESVAQSGVLTEQSDESAP